MKYATKQRKLLYDFFKNNPDSCFTVKEIITEGGLDVGDATVYRTLSAFVDENKIKKFHTGEGKCAVYQYAECNHEDSHFHLRCMSCGELFHTHCDVIGEMTKHIEAEHGFRVDAVHTTIYGLCRKCEERA